MLQKWQRWTFWGVCCNSSLGGKVDGNYPKLKKETPQVNTSMTWLTPKKAVRGRYDACFRHDRDSYLISDAGHKFEKDSEEGLLYGKVRSPCVLEEWCALSICRSSLYCCEQATSGCFCAWTFHWHPKMLSEAGQKHHKFAEERLQCALVNNYQRIFFWAAKRCVQKSTNW